MTKKQSHKIPKYTIEKYTVVQVEHEDATEKLFECVSDRWFVDETKTACFWPPPNGKPFSVRAINCEKPDDSWNVYECRVISEGHCKFSPFSIFSTVIQTITCSDVQQRIQNS